MINNAKKNQNKIGWQHINASELPMGRAATLASKFLQGKHKISYVPNQICGDNVVITNVKNIYLSGNKMNSKKYYSHSGYPGNLKTKTISDIGLVKACENAVYGMLPVNKLRSTWMKQLHIYETDDHPHKANLAGK